MPFISVVSPCYNEEGNVEEMICRVSRVLEELPGYDYEYIFIDNASTDTTLQILKRIARDDKRIKIIANTRNFGHNRSPYYALLQAKGDAVIFLASDQQDPPEMIADFIKKWEEGYKVVLAVKTDSRETAAMFLVRKLYYDLINRLSDVELVKNSTGFGLYDRRVIEIVRDTNDPYPYIRGLIAEIGFETAKIEYTQPARKRGISKNNFFTLYDLAMLGITSHSKIPLRLATMLGFSMSLLSLLAAMIYFVYKILFWQSFSVGVAPLVIGLFFFGSIQLFFLGIIGEYIGSIHTQVLRRPIVVEKERINFD
ncbi:MAG: glycosyltransferase family 2 protein [Nitrospiraceae bacterium]|nr:glycosyltransferase family 2 protein [Nitrospiraceae bacterium]